MEISLLRKVLTTIFVFTLFFGFFKVSHAQLNAAYCDVNTADPSLHPRHIICPLIRIMNLLILVSGVALVVFIGFGAIKLSTSLGDPKAYDASMKTFLFALIGFFIIVGAFALVFILDRTLGLGLGFTSPMQIGSRIAIWWDQLLCNKLWIIQPDSGCEVTWTGPSVN